MKKIVYRKRFSVDELLMVHQKVVAQRDELLKACKELDRSCGDYGVKNGVLFESAIQMARSAIKKCE